MIISGIVNWQGKKQKALKTDVLCAFLITITYGLFLFNSF